jgi:hypothetical protein
MLGGYASIVVDYMRCASIPLSSISNSFSMQVMESGHGVAVLRRFTTWCITIQVLYNQSVVELQNLMVDELTPHAISGSFEGELAHCLSCSGHLSDSWIWINKGHIDVPREEHYFDNYWMGIRNTRGCIELLCWVRPGFAERCGRRLWAAAQKNAYGEKTKCQAHRYR